MKHIRRARLLIPTTLSCFRFGINMEYASRGWSSLPCFGVAPGSAFIPIWTSARRPKQQGQRVCYLTPCHSLKKWRAVSLVHTLNVKYKVTHSHKRFNAGGNGSSRPWASYTRLFDALGIRGGVAATACSNHSGDGDRGLEENGEKMYNTVFVLGGPGSGKGTQSAVIAREYGFEHLSAGDLLRREQSSNSEVADLVHDTIKQGKIVPSEITVGLLRMAMECSGKRNILIDGFPRNQENFDAWFKIMGHCITVRRVIYLDCPADKMEERILKRGKSNDRADDNLESLRRRFETYRLSTMPILDYFKKMGLVTRVDASGDINTVTSLVRAEFSNNMEHNKRQDRHQQQH